MVLQEAVTRLSSERYTAQEVSGEETYGLIKPPVPLSNRIANATHDSNYRDEGDKSGAQGGKQLKSLGRREAMTLVIVSKTQD